ncbi:universal stress protein [Streptomyces sp. HD1123-B1]|uniref:universal stress protein n=1 Tax=Streptomyces huangiella TaxID=3228804 RepID=UPI003D7C653E
MTQPITAGLDGSPESLAAVDWAAEEALRRGAPLRLVHAWMLPPQTARTAQAPEARRLWGQELLDWTQKQVRDRYPKVEVATELLAHTPVEALVAEGASTGLLVLGAHGRGAMGGFLLGSVGLRVLTLSHHPVVMVHKDAAVQTEPGEGDILVGIQDPPGSAVPIEFAFATAQAHGTGVRAVRACAPPPVFPHKPRAEGLTEETSQGEAAEMERLVEAVALWREKYPGVPVTEEVERGHAAEVLLTAASRASLVVVGRPAHRPVVGPRIGHIAHALLHHADCPVAVVPYE